jgi:hypothetical protein
MFRQMTGCHRLHLVWRHFQPHTRPVPFLSLFPFLHLPQAQVSTV